MSESQSLVPNARTLAARVLGRVLADGAFAAAALDSELSRHLQLEPRERALATELVYGVLRTRRALEQRLERYAPKKIQDFSTRLHLLVGAYQILLLDRVPAFAAVNSAVAAVRAERGPRVAGFANAVLRKLSASGERLLPANAIAESAPAWLLERLSSSVGREEALATLGAGAGSPSVGLRVTAGRAPPAWISDTLPGRWTSRARRLERGGQPQALPGYSEGDFVVQEEGAQIVALLSSARPGQRVLDACAGRGQKTSLLTELVAPGGRVFATDLYPKKLDALSREFERLQLPMPETRAVDWAVGVADVPDDFDCVLVDAPCTGTGTLRHRPEILERLGPDDPIRLAELATAILRGAASRAKPGARVVFAVCSLLPEEGEAVLERVRDLLEPLPFAAPELAGLLPDGACTLKLLPLAHGTDGYFVASFQRRA